MGRIVNISGVLTHHYQHGGRTNQITRISDSDAHDCPLQEKVSMHPHSKLLPDRTIRPFKDLISSPGAGSPLRQRTRHDFRLCQNCAHGSASSEGRASGNLPAEPDAGTLPSVKMRTITSKTHSMESPVALRTPSPTVLLVVDCALAMVGRAAEPYMYRMSPIPRMMS